MINIDPAPLYIAASAAAIAVALLGLGAWIVQRRLHLLTYGIANLLVGAAFTLPVVQAVAGTPGPGLFDPVLDNGGAIAGLALVWSTIRLIMGRRPLFWAAPAGLLIWAALCLWPEVFEPRPAQFVISLDAYALFTGLTLHELLREGVAGRAGKRLPSQRMAAAVFAVMTAAFAARGLSAPFAPPGPVNELELPFEAEFVLLEIMFICSGAFILLALEGERSEAASVRLLTAAHAETESARRFLDRLVSGLPGMVVRGALAADGVMTVTYIGNGAARVAGPDAVARLGQGGDLRDLVHPHDLPSIDAKRAAVRRDG